MKIPDEIVRMATVVFLSGKTDTDAMRAALEVAARWAMEEAAKVILTQCHDDHTREEEAAAIRARKDEM